MAFAIVTDTSANLPSALVREHGVTVIPFTYTFDGVELTSTDIAAFDGPTFYAAMRKGTAVTTSLISPERYASCFRPILEAGQDLLFVSMSSGISGSYQAAALAAEELREAFPERTIRLVDALGASLGEGLLVLEAVRCRAAGQDLYDTAGRLLSLRRRVCQVFTVDDLQYLRRGGRLSNMAAVVGTVLNIKPILKGNEEGKIVSTAKVRGRKKAIETLAARYETLVAEPETQTVGIAHADCAEDAETLAALLRKNKAPREILTVMYEPVTGSHVGPGTLALFFLGNEDVRSK